MRLLLVAFIFSVTTSAQTLIIRQAHIVDPLTRTVALGDVEIVNGMISRVELNKPYEPGDPEFRIVQEWKYELDGADKWIIPGLHDMHVHSYGNPAPGGVMDVMGTQKAAKTMLYAGVTAFLDLFAPEDAIFALRDKQRQSDLQMADIYAAGPILTCTGGHGTEYGLPTRVINSPADAERELSALALKKPDVVKIVYDHAFGAMPTIDKATMEAAVQGASKRGLKTVIHIGTWQDACEAILAGATCITHVHGQPIPADLVTLMHERGVYEIPTLSVQSELANISRQPLLLDSPLLAKTATKSVIDAYRDTSKFDKRTKAFRDYTSAEQAAVKANVKAMHTGNVKLMAGTDCGNLGTFQGYSLHREMELMVEAGLSSWDALASATTTAGSYLGEKVGFRVGDIANFVLLNKSPIDDIRNTQDIAAVVYYGRVVNREILLNPPVVKWSTPLLDEFNSNSTMSTSEREWQTDLDTTWGGKSTMSIVYGSGVIHASGKAIPSGGRPALAGLSLPLSDEAPVDLTAFTGVRLRFQSSAGPVQLKLITTGISNYDYHAVNIPAIDGPRTLEFPFSSFKQQWSDPVAWTGKDVSSIALWVSTFGVPTDFDFIIDAIELY